MPVFLTRAYCWFLEQNEYVSQEFQAFLDLESSSSNIYVSQSIVPVSDYYT